jgi:multidrug efflux pump subunit AcrB
MWLIKASLRNPYMVATIVFMILFLGGLSLTKIPVDILPVFKAPAVQVITYYQGMPASSIEKTITNRIERWCNQSPGAQTVVSKSVPGVSVVRIYFRDDIDPNGALTMTGQLALGTLATMPPNTLPPVVLPFDPTGTLPLGLLTVSNATMDEAHVKDVGRIWVRNMLGAVPGCVAPVAVGGKDRTILVYLDPKKMEARHLSSADVVEALKDGNMMVTPGIAYFGDDQLLLDSNMMADKIEELNDLPITADPNNHVLLKDIGEIRDSYTIQTSRVRIDGRKEVYVPIYRQQGASSLDVARGVQAHMKYMEEHCPAGTKLHFVMDQTIYVTEAIHALLHEGIIGAVLVSIMILIFLGNWRMTLIASMSIPLALLGAIVGLYVTGNTINAMTLGALALAVAFAMFSSFLLSRTFVPMMCAKFLPDDHGRHAAAAAGATVLVDGGHGHHDEHAPTSFFGRIHHRIEGFLDNLTHGYQRLLRMAIRCRFAVLSVVGVLFLGSLALGTRLGREFFPQVDAGQITVYLRAPSNTRLDATERRVAAAEEFIKKQIPAEERQMIVSEIGVTPDWSAAYTENSGQQDCVIRVQLTDERKMSAQEYAIKLRHAFRDEPQFADLRLSLSTGGIVSTALNYGASSPIDIQVEGGSRQEGLALAREIRNRVRGVHGVADARVMQRLDAPYLVINVNRVAAASVGLTPRDVIQQVVAAMNSSISLDRNFWVDAKSGNQYFVAVQYAEDPNMSLDDVLDVAARGTNQCRRRPDGQ